MHAQRGRVGSGHKRGRRNEQDVWLQHIALTLTKGLFTDKALSAKAEHCLSLHKLEQLVAHFTICHPTTETISPRTPFTAYTNKNSHASYAITRKNGNASCRHEMNLSPLLTNEKHPTVPQHVCIGE